MENSAAQIRCPHCQSKKTNKVTMNTYYCMKSGVEFNADTLEIFFISCNGSLEKVAKDGQ